MPKFIKLKLNGVPDKSETIQWRLVISTVEEVEEYHSLSIALNMEAFMTMERDKSGHIALSHTGAAPTRAIPIQKLLNLAIDTTPAGQKVYPLVEVAKMTDSKTMGMFKYVTNIGAIQLNEAGGYCGLDSFIKTWDAEILEEIVKPDFGFPLNDAVLNADTIVLENSHKDYSGSYMESQIKKDVPNYGSIKTIFNLREIDNQYIVKCINNCKNVVIKTQAQSDSQLTLFMQLFKAVQSKNIYLYVSKEVEDRIRQHADFNVNNSTHQITFNNN